MKTIRRTNMFQLYRKMVSGRFVQDVANRHEMRLRSRIYPLGVSLWLMIKQRLEAPGTLAQAVSQRAQGDCGILLPRRRRQRRPAKISLRTGGYCRARQRIPRAVMQEIIEGLTAALQTELGKQLPPGKRPMYLMDGSSVQLQHRAELLENYPPAENQYGRSRWPVMRLVVLHDAVSGLALRPAWGPMYGEHAVSEQALAERLLDQLPAEAVLIADRNFGIFHTAHAAHQRRQAVIVRLSEPRARRLGGQLTTGTDRVVVWKPSQEDRRAHAGLSADAAVPGRLVICELAGQRGQLYLFTTLDLPAAELMQLYALRWNIETDLRSVKQTVRLHRLTGHSIDIAEKEILAAIAAYNLIRTVMCLAAQQAGLHPRRLSFSQVLYLVNAFWPDVLEEIPSPRGQRQLRRMISLAADCTLPQRSHHRSYPREVWPRPSRYPKKHEPKPQSK